MRLKSVELFGFKSFPERTVIEFGQGITAILGPNGCGKSNVVDAIKWVLGEKSAKNLRGEEMLDVIFAGCETRSPSGMAEVKLNFDNSDQTLPLPYNEVCVSRRIYRSRESEYQINGNSCRMKDIRDLFLDTGVGSSAYSVIEQGRVEALLHAKPADRRAVFEEAAGIAKFKVMRKDILARLDRTGQVLVRLSDKLDDKDKHIKKVSAQAANARRHRKLTLERDGVRTLLYRRQFAEQTARLADLLAKRELLEAEAAREDLTMVGLEKELVRLSEEEAELSARRNAAVESASNTQEELSAVLLGQANAQNRIESLRNEIDRGNARRAELSARLERLTAQEEEARTALGAAREKTAELETRFAEQDRNRQDLMKAVAESEAAVTDLRNRIIDMNRRRQELASEAARAEAAEQTASLRSAELDARLARIVEEQSNLSAAVEGLEAEYRQASERFAGLADGMEAMRRQRKDLEAEAETLLAEERAADSERAAKASRKATLEDLENSFDGAFEGVKNVLMAARGPNPACQGVVGMALDLMTVPMDLALAVETILGGSAQDVVVESARDAQAAIEYLKRNRLGRATFLPLDRIQPRRRLTQSFRHIPGVVGEAVELVSFDRRHNAVMEYLLAGILVVETLDLARELAGREARGVKIVTLEGDVVSPSGAMTGGHGKQRRAGLVQRKAELDALTTDLADCERRLAEKSRRRKEAAETMGALARRVSEMEGQMAEVGRSEGGIRQNLAVRKSELERILKDRAEAERERNGVADSGNGRREKLEELRHDLARVEGELAGLEQDVAAGTQAQRSAREAADALGNEFAALSGERSAAQAGVREFERRLDALSSEQNECRAELARPGMSSPEAEQEIEQHAERLAGLKRREEELLRLRDERRATGSELAERLAENKSQAESLRQREREAQTQANRIREGVSQIDRQTTECEMRMANLREKAFEELRLSDLSFPESAPEPAAESESAAATLFPGEAIEAPARPKPAEMEWDALSDTELQAKVDELSQKIRNIGNVYPEAIDELVELEASAEFLRSQKEDIEETITAFHIAIDKLNAESSARFQETFATVRTNFQQLFTGLFGGGRADLILEEVTDPEADPLEAGIDIRAQPPGKEPKSISLLSGGEKALCAVALLFALFRSKPSPFCILDEVDGPLDESNIDRFMQQVKDFTNDTQFIIITHSQRTMGMTDEIWGVTQKVPGISSINSLKFDAMEYMSREKGRREEATAVRAEVGA